MCTQSSVFAGNTQWISRGLMNGQHRPPAALYLCTHAPILVGVVNYEYVCVFVSVCTRQFACASYCCYNW
jgi:hypothetical protein